MASTYSTNLKIELMGTGDQVGTWGTTTNNNFQYALEEAIVGYGAPQFTNDTNLTLTLSNSNATQTARKIFLYVTSTVTLTAQRDLIVPTIEKTYIVHNNTTGGQAIRVKTSAGTGIVVPSGKKMLLYVNGTNVIEQIDYATTMEVGTLTIGALSSPLPVASGGTGASTAANARTNLGLGTIATQAANNVAITGGSITGITDLAIADGGTGASTANGALNNLLPTQTANSGKYLKTDGTNSSWDALDISTADITGTLPIANGGTNATTAANARTNLGLGTIATQAANNVSITGGSVTGVTFSSSNATITGGSITGITDLAVADGGTGASSFTANNVLLGNGTSAFQVVAPSTNGNILSSNGTTWTSSARVPLQTAVTPTGTNYYVDFTGIPSTVKRITMIFHRVTLASSLDVVAQLITSGGLVTSGYISGVTTAGGNSGSTTAFRLTRSSPSSTNGIQGIVTFINVTDNIWAEAGNLSDDGNVCNSSAGSVSLASALTGIRFGNEFNTANLTGGKINVIYE